LLALDSPVREGVLFDATDLLGRDADIRAVHALLATSRVVTVLGAGGLGKTRLAHVLGRQASQPVVHMVELVSVTVTEDLIGEVGSSLGVRDSVSGRRALTPEQRADVRARIAQHLDQAPSLLILDNCEHIVAAVADLVAYLVATTRTLRVLTTSRAPLAISAETVYPLGELSTADGVELFRRRAVAARPDVVLDENVTEIVERLDGLPLAIELAAAKVRVMGVADIARRLENRFALLRGGDRSAPDRHQTLLAVIDWSWNLLAERERRALRWLSVFHDGFTLDAAESVLGLDALEAVANLADQSLVDVVEDRHGIRYRMLETVREFGRMQLVDAGEDDLAQAAHRDWAITFATVEGRRLMTADQFDAVAGLRAEEGNLADALRRALAADDPETVVRLFATLATYWSIRGDHGRVIVLLEALVAVLDGWTPPPAAADAARISVVVALNHGFLAAVHRTQSLLALARALGPESDDPRVAAMTRIALAFDSIDSGEFTDKIRAFSDSDDRLLALLGRQMLSHVLENEGDPAGAVEAAERALDLVEDADGPWLPAILHTQIAQLVMQAGEAGRAVPHAREALPVLERLGSTDDSLQLRSLLVLAAIRENRLDAAAAGLDELMRMERSEALFGAELVFHLGEAEVALARGDVTHGLAVYRTAVRKVRDVRFPGLNSPGLEPWILFAESAALTAHAYHATDAALIWAEELVPSTIGRLDGVLDPSFPYLDYPVCGLVFFALGSWGLLRGGLPVEDAARCLVLADRFAYNRTVPTMTWDRIVPVAEQRAPGLLERTGKEFGERRGPELLDVARALVKDLGAWRRQLAAPGCG
jgi:predicted ATPase